MKKIKRILSLVLALAMVMAMGITSFAAENDANDTVTVLFTKNCSKNTNAGSEWLGYTAANNTLYAGGTVSVASLANCTKSYIPANTEDPMNGVASVMDAIMAAQPSYVFSTGWDATPWSGDPGAYINNVQNTNLESNYTETESEDDENILNCRSWGTGFVVIIQDANGNRTFPTEYVSNIEVEAGMTIYVDLASYDYTWTKTVEN